MKVEIVKYNGLYYLDAKTGRELKVKYTDIDKGCFVYNEDQMRKIFDYCLLMNIPFSFKKSIIY